MVTLRKDKADSNNIRYLPTRSEILRGFGNGSRCHVVGKRILLLKVDDAVIETEVFIVPEEGQEDAIILGKSALDRPSITLSKEFGKLTIRQDEMDENKELKSFESKEVSAFRPDRNTRGTICARRTEK